MDYPDSMIRELIQGGDRSKWVARSNHSVKCFTQDEIIKFTNNYKTMLGRGGFGEVYEGVLEDKTIVAVKKFIYNAKENFAKELTVHREINHKNVVRLLGYCLDENTVMMVTEYIPKGNLSDVLHRDKIPIPLDTRLRIAIECADALGYMHSQMYTQVIHGDIKPANILLDNGLKAKVSDFGISRLVDTEKTLHTLNVIGSIGYMDPLFAQSGRLTTKSDVYSFAVVLLELITRKKAVNDDGRNNLVESFTHALAKGIRSVRKIFDAEIATPSSMKIIEGIAKLAGRCLRLERDKRPDMLEVAAHLCKLREALHQGQERVALFSWRKKNNAPAENSRIVWFGLTKTALRVGLKDLREASTEILGESTAWTTYKAKLVSGTELVFKRLTGVNLPKREFEKRVAAIGAINNQHIRPLRGYYYGNNEQLLLYDHMFMALPHEYVCPSPPRRWPPPTLFEKEHVCPTELDSTQGHLKPTWKRRLDVSLDVARGVASIHSAGPLSCHGNIKASNVLLTRTRTTDACLSEHGLTTLVGLSPALSDYQAPEVTSDIRSVSQKADVYSFGILVLELLTERGEEKLQNLPQWVCGQLGLKWMEREPQQWVMPSVIADMWMTDLFGFKWCEGEEEGIVALLELAMDCCSHNANLRPAMSDVVQKIQDIQQLPKSHTYRWMN